MNRREQLYLLWAISATGLLIALAAALIASALPRSPTRFVLGRVDEFPLGAVKLVNLPEDFVDPLAISITAPKVWVVRHEDGTFTALYARSTVHGNPVGWMADSQHFVDGALGNKWDRDGKYLEGPDPRDPDRFPVTVENGQVIIELRLIQGASDANLHKGGRMKTSASLAIRSEWHTLALALLPAVALIAFKSGILQRLGGSPSLLSTNYPVFGLCLAMVVVSLVREHRLAIWSYPALGILLSGVLLLLVGAVSVLTQSLEWGYSVIPWIEVAMVWGIIVLLAVRYRVGAAASRGLLLVVGALVIVYFLEFALDISTLNGGPGAYLLRFFAAPSSFFLGLSLLPLLMVWKLGRAEETQAALVILVAEFFFLDMIYDPGYAIGMRTRDPTIARLVDLLPAIGFLGVSPVWVLAVRSFRSQVAGLLLPPALALTITELLAGSLRPYFAMTMWLHRGLGASEYMLIVALAILLYQVYHDLCSHMEHELPLAQETA